MIAGPAAGLVSVALRDQNGRILPGLVVGDRWFVVGEEGRRYSIVDSKSKRVCGSKWCSQSMGSTCSMAGRLRFGNAVT